MEPVRMLFSAINGYGFYYLKTLLEEVTPGKAIVAGIVDPEPEKSGHFNWIRQNNIPVFGSMEDFYASGLKADLAIISSPPQFHVEQAMTALNNGTNVLVDKPAGVGARDVKKLIETSAETGRWVEVGYQWSFSKAVRELKNDINAGFYGSPLRAASICLWPRDYAYYRRNNWAGRITDPEGRLVFDSPANNACAHFMHNLLFLLEGFWHKQFDPISVEGLKFRVYDIENFDTISLKVGLKYGIELFFYSSHAAENSHDPEFIIEFSEGEVRYEGKNPQIIGRTSQGVIRNYGSPEDDHQFKKLLQCIDAVGEPYKPVCPPEAALAHTKIIDRIQESKEDILTFPEHLTVMTDKRRWVKGLNQTMKEAYKGFEWLMVNVIVNCKL